MVGAQVGAGDGAKPPWAASGVVSAGRSPCLSTPSPGRGFGLSEVPASALGPLRRARETVSGKGQEWVSRQRTLRTTEDCFLDLFKIVSDRTLHTLCSDSPVGI